MVFIQPAVLSRKESQRWARQVPATRSRSSTTWSTPRPARATLAASPAGPAPTTAQSIVCTRSSPLVERPPQRPEERLGLVDPQEVAGVVDHVQGPTISDAGLPGGGQRHHPVLAPPDEVGG